MKSRTRCGAIGAFLVLMSCNSTPEAFVAGERAVHDAIAPEYLEYVEADATLSAESKQRRKNTVARWDESLRAQEKQR